MAVAIIALFVALAGTGYAALSLPKNSVGARQLRNGAVVTAKLGNRAVTKAKLNLKGVTVPKARRATRADHATSADTALTAGGAAPTGHASGDLSGSYPAPVIAAAPTPTDIAANPVTSTDPCAQASPQTGIFCGTTGGGFWSASTYSGNGVQIWRDRLGEMHIRGEARFSTSYAAAGPLFYLPSGERPATIQAFPVATGPSAGAFQAGSGLLVMYPSTGFGAANGSVALFDPGYPGGSNVFIGDIEFRTDA